VGGLAIGLAWGLQALLLGPERGYGLFPGGSAAQWRLLPAGDPWLQGAALAPWSVALGLLVALGSGWIDDLRREGLPAWAKVLLQALAGLCLSLYLYAGTSAQVVLLLDDDPIRELESHVIVCSLVFMGLAVFALNAANTFDNADGALCGVAGCGLLLAASPLAPAVLCLLVPNLLLRRKRAALPASGPGDPWVYLGDAGSQLVGLALVITPGAWPALLLPALDLGRVAWVRVARGQRPWVGDRRHLAHRLQRRGLAPLPVLLVLLCLGAPALLLPWAWGLPGTALLFALACLWTRAVAEPA
jgi:UDP-GlcNAc:undecaprenyl-phosphate GlcNAc-1-phosphate transferase